jgi:hypothetical protein
VKPTAKKKPYKIIALALSLCALIVWGILGTGASLAWFADTSPEVNNIFHFADFKLEVSHRLTDGSWEKVDSQTKLFDDEALYEPGYVQVVYLKAENKGERAFRYDTAVTVTGFTLATNIFGQQFSLQDYLKFGLITAATEDEMKSNVPDRQAAQKIATSKLNRYYNTDTAQILNPGECAYIALIVRMPEDVGNAANYRGGTIPKVDLGIIITADQIKN